MTKEDHEKQIGYPQVIARMVKIDGRQALFRLQKPYSEKQINLTLIYDFKTGELKAKPPDKEELAEFETLLIVEMWSDATKSIVTQAITKAPHVSEDEFSYAVRYMMNKATDSELEEVAKEKRLNIVFNFTTGKDDTGPLVTPKSDEK